MATRYPIPTRPAASATLRQLLPAEAFVARRYAPAAADDDDDDDDDDGYGDGDGEGPAAPYEVPPDPALLANADVPLDQIDDVALGALLPTRDAGDALVGLLIERIWHRPALLSWPPFRELGWRARGDDRARYEAARGRFAVVEAARRVAGAGASGGVAVDVDVDGHAARVVVDKGGAHVGRGGEIALDDVDADHARVYFNDGFVLVDGGSAVGTRVNGVFVDAHRLQPGDVVQIGRHALRLAIDARVGGVVGHSFRVVAPIGAGVFRGAHVDSDAAVIVKFADGCDDAEGLVGRVRAAAAVDDRGVVKCFVVGVDDGGVVYVVSRVAGGRAVGGAPRPLHEVVRIGAGVAAALAAAHDAAVVHGRLSPAVVHDDDGHVFVRDFGWWWRARDAPIAFAAPEVVRGAVPTAPSDVWSFGALLFTLLAGSTVFDGSLSDRLRALTEAEPVAPPSTPPALASLLTSSLAPLPEQRPSASAWLQAFAALSR